MAGEWRTRRASADHSIFPAPQAGSLKGEARLDPAGTVNLLLQGGTLVLVTRLKPGHALSFLLKLLLYFPITSLLARPDHLLPFCLSIPGLTVNCGVNYTVNCLDPTKICYCQKGDLGIS
jgi:hypothetical protein